MLPGPSFQLPQHLAQLLVYSQRSTSVGWCELEEADSLCGTPSYAREKEEAVRLGSKHP